MATNETSVEMLFQKAEDYASATIELLKLKAIDRSADIASSVITNLVISLVVALSVLTANIGIALWLGELLGQYYFGFFAVAGFYALIALLVYSFRHQWIKEPVSNAVIIQMLKKKDA